MFDTIVKILLTIAAAGILVGLLPASPFAPMIEAMGQIPYLSYVNWFLPIAQIATTAAAWAVCMGAYYVIAWILRQLNIVSQ